MPTPDGREWLKPSQIAFITRDHIQSMCERRKDAAGVPLEGAARYQLDLTDPLIRQALWQALKDAWEDMYGLDFKMNRLYEKLQVKTLNDELTLEQVKTAFDTIRSMDFLQQVNEDGELI